MIESLLLLHTLFVTTATGVLLSWLLLVRIRERRRAARDAVLRSRYLRIVMLALLADRAATLRFPMLGRSGTRRLLAETLASLADITYGLDGGALRRIVDAYGIDRWLLRRIRLSRGDVRARWLLLLSRLPAGPEEAGRVARYARDRNRQVRFQTLMVRLACDPSAARRLMSEYAEPFTSCEVEEIMGALRRGMLPIAYEPLVTSECRNLRIVGLHIVRRFGIEEAERLLLRVVARDDAPDLGREALYTLCSLRCPLAARDVCGVLTAMEPAERKALLRYMAAEGYSPEALRQLLDDREQPYYESLVKSYKRSLA